MTGAESLNLLMGRLSRTNVALRANALLEMKHYQQMALEKGEIMPDFLIVRRANVTLTAGNQQFTLPLDFLRELDEDTTLWITDDDGNLKAMTKLDDDDVESKFESTDTGLLPLEYKIEGLYGYAFPIPITTRTLKLSYYGTGATIADDAVETVWLKHASDLIIGGAGLVIASLYVKDPEAAAVFAAMEGRGKMRLLNEQTARQEAGRSRRMG